MEIKTDSRFKHFECEEQIQMGLDLDNAHNIMSLLRNNIYSNPIQSWVREIYSNAVDAHARVGNTEDAIDIDIVETDPNYEFIVRDYGASMDKEQIATVYAKMGKSDKTTGNTEMGGWGLGAKSPLAYTDHFWIETFTIESNCNIYRKWVQYIDASRVGALGLMHEEVIDTPDFRTGTKVIVPFDRNDYKTVHHNILVYLAYTNAKYKLGEGIEYKYARPKYRFYGEGWALGQYSDYYWRHSTLSFKDKGVAVIGDIPYRIDFKSLYKFFEDNDLKHCTQKLMPKQATMEADLDIFDKFLIALRIYSFEIELPIGSVDLSASREDLQYTRHTCTSLYKAFYKFYIGFCQDVKINLIYRNNLPESCIRFENDYGGYMREEVLNTIVWYRKPIKFTSEPSIFHAQANCKKYRLGQTNGKSIKTILRSFDTSKLELGSHRYYIVRQDTSFVNVSKYIKFWLIQKGYDFKDNMMVVSSKDFYKVSEWVKESLEVINMSDMVDYHKDNYTVVRRTALADKGNFKTLVYAGSVERERASGMGRYFDQEEVPIEPDEEYYYIDEEEYRYSPVKFVGYDSYLCTAFNKYLSSRGISKSSIVLAKKLTRNYKHENWINLLDYIKDDVNKYKSKLAEYVKSAFIHMICNKQFPLITDMDMSLITNEGSIFSELRTDYETCVAYMEANSEVGPLLNLYDSATRKINEDFKGYWSKNYDAEIVQSKFEPYGEYILPMFNKFKNFFDRYPLTQVFNTGNWDNRGLDLEVSHFAEYINLLEPIRGDIKIEEPEDSSYKFSQLIDKFKPEGCGAVME